MATPVGRWKTVDDQTGKTMSIIQIWEERGRLYGKIEKIFPEPGEDQNPLCEKGPADKRNKPIIGMTIMEGFKQEGNEWRGGTILDPESGKVYKCQMEVVEGGNRLKVRGYIGISLVGRTQYWPRAD